MKITSVKAVYPNYQHVVPSWRTHFCQIVVRVETDMGVAGLGYGGGGAAAVEVVNRHFSELLVGQTIDTVDDITSAWDRLYDASLPYGRKGIAVMALSGVDLALWDLLGRAEGKPVHQLVGARTKDRVPAYARPSGPAAHPKHTRGTMKITSVKAVYPNYQHVVPSWRTHFCQIVVRVETDMGVAGLGYGGGGAAAVEVVNRHFSELLVGQTIDTVDDITSAWDRLYDASLPYGRKGIAVMALSGVGIWKGKDDCGVQ